MDPTHTGAQIAEPVGEAVAVGRPVFSATIHPHRSLGLRGIRLVIVLVAGASLVASIPFIVLGFWPVAGFYGLDVLLLYFALRASLEQAKAYEQIVISPLELMLRKVPVKGRARRMALQPDLDEAASRGRRGIRRSAARARIARAERPGRAVPFARREGALRRQYRPCLGGCEAGTGLQSLSTMP